MSLDIRPIIGLEIHVQLATRTKMFCRCELAFAAEPNSRVCPVCMGMPGTLPVMNRAAFEYSLMAGIALGCEVAPFTKWDRKSYYYPDMPKNYQISQYDLPLASSGAFEIPLPDGTLKPIGIIRAHLEEDAGKNLHEGLDHTRVDLNRAGTPLLEIVTEPDLASADEAYSFCVELQRLVRHLGISEASMQKGHMRFEPNVNVAITHEGREYRTPISEVKNLNSFRSVRGAIRYEVERQVKTWEADHDFTLEKQGKMNMGWNDALEITEFQRGKEESHDYRYFPDPDLVPVDVSDVILEALRERVGESPLHMQRRFVEAYGVTEKDCEILIADRATARLYEEAIRAGADVKTLSKQFVGIWNQIASSTGCTVGGLGIPAATMSRLVQLVVDGTVSASAASQVAARVHADGDRGDLSLHDIARELGVIQERDEGAMLAWIEEAFAQNAKAVEDAIAEGSKKAQKSIGFLRGQVMRISQGKADPRLAGELIEKKLAELKDQT